MLSSSYLMLFKIPVFCETTEMANACNVINANIQNDIAYDRNFANKTYCYLLKFMI